MDELYDIAGQRILGYVKELESHYVLKPVSHIASTDMFAERLLKNLYADKRIFSIGYNVIIIRRSPCTKQD